MGLVLPIVYTTIGILLLISKTIKKYCMFFYMFYISNGFSVFNILSTNIDSHVYWSSHLSWCLNTSFIKLKQSYPLYGNRTNKTMFFINHRSLADVFVHDAIINFQASYLASQIIKYLIPTTWMATFMDNSVWFFKRGGIHTDANRLQNFYGWLSNNYNSKCAIRKSLIVYPEGHRNKSKNPLPLNMG